MRYGCSGGLRNAVFHRAMVAAQHDELCRTRYRALRARGCRHGRALGTVGDGLLRVACAMLASGTLYRADRWIAAQARAFARAPW